MGRAFIQIDGFKVYYNTNLWDRKKLKELVKERFDIGGFDEVMKYFKDMRDKQVITICK